MVDINELQTLLQPNVDKNDLSPVRKYKKDSIYVLSTARHLYNQIHKNEFYRADILIRRYTIEQYLNDKSYDFSLYKKMQKTRVAGRKMKSPDGFIESFKNTIKGFLYPEEESPEKFNPKKPITVSRKEYIIQDGSHRTSIAYYLNLPNVYIRYTSRNNTCKPYGRDWFIKNNFNEEEIFILDEEHKKLKEYLISHKNEI